MSVLPLKKQDADFLEIVLEPRISPQSKANCQYHPARVTHGLKPHQLPCSSAPCQGQNPQFPGICLHRPSTPQTSAGLLSVTNAALKTLGDVIKMEQFNRCFFHIP